MYAGRGEERVQVRASAYSGGKEVVEREYVCILTIFFL